MKTPITLLVGTLLLGACAPTPEQNRADYARMTHDYDLLSPVRMCEGSNTAIYRLPTGQLAVLMHNRVAGSEDGAASIHIHKSLYSIFSSEATLETVC
jgi:hypothetical protein